MVLDLIGGPCDGELLEFDFGMWRVGGRINMQMPRVFDILRAPSDEMQYVGPRIVQYEIISRTQARYISV